jgi:hypothetical protein
MNFKDFFTSFYLKLEEKKTLQEHCFLIDWGWPEQLACKNQSDNYGGDKIIILRIWIHNICNKGLATSFHTQESSMFFLQVERSIWQEKQSIFKDPILSRKLT